MLFARRQPATMAERVRLAVWPRRSFLRSARYAGLRIVRLGGAPASLALGVATGVFVATLPLPGLQMALAAALAWVVRGHVAASVLATFWANPLTMPFIWLLAHAIGQWLLGDGSARSGDVLEAIAAVARVANTTVPDLTGLGTAVTPVLLPLLLGGLVLGAVTATVFYGLTLHLLLRHRLGRLRPRRPESAAALIVCG